MDVRALLRRYEVWPKKSLGQNFLVDENALEQIIVAADLAPDDVVLEIGPGLGTLTRLLARAGRAVVAVELDNRLIPILQEVLAPYPNVELVHGDILQLDPEKLIAPLNPPEKRYQVVANIPYYITSAVIRHLLEAGERPGRMVLTIQLEVAQRIVAAPGDMSLLAVGVQFYGHPQIVGRIKAGSFYPVPKVDSAIVRIDVHDQLPVADDDIEPFFAIVKAGFAERRKQLRNSLSHGLNLPPATGSALLQMAGIDPRRRAETLSLSEWTRLAHVARDTGLHLRDVKLS